MPRTTNPIYAIGYSNLSISKFIELLKSHSITMVADVRSIPKSRHQPDFNEDTIEETLKKNDIKYIHFKDLGGLREPSKESTLNNGWKNESFRGFADYMQTKKFEGALLKLIKMSDKDTIVLMCAEGNPFRCHRSLIADALTVRGRKVYNISGVNASSLHKLTWFAKVKESKITYPE